MNPVLSAFLALFAASMLGAQQPLPRPASAHEHDTPRATATRITGVIHIDGVLNEPEWRTAEPVTRFTQLDPQEGKPASERTDIRFLVAGSAGVFRQDREFRRDFPGTSFPTWVASLWDRTRTSLDIGSRITTRSRSLGSRSTMPILLGTKNYTRFSER